MKSTWNLIASILQLVIGVAAILSFLTIGLSGENTAKWIVTLLLAIAFVILGIIGIVDYSKKK